MDAEPYLRLSGRIRAAGDLAELAFVLCNETRALVEYRQAAILVFGSGGRATLMTHSGLAAVDANTPFALWIAEAATALRPALPMPPASAAPLAATAASVPERLAAGWSEWLPGHALLFPLGGPDGVLRAVLVLARDEPWPHELEEGSPERWLAAAAQAGGHAWWALSARAPRAAERAGALLRSRTLWALAAAALLLLAVPVREYALAPAEVISLASEVIAAPQAGVIRQMRVKPNAMVRKGDVLAEFDDTTLRNRLAVARASMATARADFLQSSQRAFERQEARAEMGQAEARVRERETEIGALAAEMARQQVLAPADGVFIYSHPDDWAGKPVQTGERIGLLSDPARLGVQAWVPVADAINLAPGAAMTLLLRVAPLQPLPATLQYASYQVVDSPEGIAGYRVRGSLDAPAGVARLGLRGTVRISGESTPLGYLLLRRPVAALREWCGC
ncbi:MAG: efflux RND transporter periplasmic adaptor subunit [Betaproteobacteria bacterium]|jgi:multidrug efflux pump subunit AcrA (membrane-fusion protein)|nr:HlyD family efflux transporter periplasmic adaptor subunit [Rhodocyclaceae bacterium]MCA3133374.1 HlyD family efflux transporter periplasmic adaptor subunit [Rhodocyclaceae bacterium]MCA3143371.1 HlyD family efflux transporter periplasmic adaptor subunit [Rhodocyclaceae bacterium]MCA3147051.1 HlyD family efflux transporter periplasmic adaptor subunit [Rhodocyclaceae bacterium]